MPMNHTGQEQSTVVSRPTLTLMPKPSYFQQKGDIKPPVKYSSFKRNDPLGIGGKGLWRIHSGYVRTLSWTLEGELVPLGFWGAGDIIGYPITQTSPYAAKCLSPVQAEYLGTAYGCSQGMMLSQVRQSHDLLKISHCRQADLRLLQFICWMAGRFGQRTSEGRTLKLRLTHQEISEAINLTRVTVSRLLKALEREGKIRWTPSEKMVYQETFKEFYANLDSCDRIY